MFLGARFGCRQEPPDRRHGALAVIAPYVHINLLVIALMRPKIPIRVVLLKALPYVPIMFPGIPVLCIAPGIAT
jgi:hypothetical protein